MSARCPRCESKDLAPCAELLEASDEEIRATHECQRCRTRFRFTPADKPFNPIRFAGVA